MEAKFFNGLAPLVMHCCVRFVTQSMPKITRYSVQKLCLGINLAYFFHVYFETDFICGSIGLKQTDNYYIFIFAFNLKLDCHRLGQLRI